MFSCSIFVVCFELALRRENVNHEETLAHSMYELKKKGLKHATYLLGEKYGDSARNWETVMLSMYVSGKCSKTSPVQAVNPN